MKIKPTSSAMVQKQKGESQRKYWWLLLYRLYPCCHHHPSLWTWVWLWRQVGSHSHGTMLSGRAN